MTESLNAQVSFTSGGEPGFITVFSNDTEVATAKMVGSSAVIKKMYPLGCDYVMGEECLQVLNYLESLPMVQAIQFGEVDE